MKTVRTIARILLIVGILLLLLGIALAAMSMYNALFGIGAMGIIGGVDAISVWTLFFARLTDKYATLTYTGLVMIALSVILFVIGRKKKNEDPQ